MKRNKIFMIAAAIMLFALAAVLAEPTGPPGSHNEKEDKTPGGGGAGGKECWHSITSDPLHQVYYCGTCSFISGSKAWNSGKGKC